MVSKLCGSRFPLDLAFISVLLDAGAGEHWSYLDPVTQTRLTRSEGLAAASIALFFNHLAQFDPEQGWSVEGETLAALPLEVLAKAFDHSESNPLVGLEGRWQLLKQLGEALMTLGAHTRPSIILDACLEKTITNGAVKGSAATENSDVPAGWILELVLKEFGGIWPNGFVWNGHFLGDCGYHPGLGGPHDLDAIIPFHKLSQWLTYSLVEPLAWAGITVTELDQLTGLPEYRNGGLLLDTGVLSSRSPTPQNLPLRIDSPWVVEWRAMTVFLLDVIAQSVRIQLDKTDSELPLCAVLQGGTWAAGRHIAQQRRQNGSAPVALAISGTLF